MKHNYFFINLDESLKLKQILYNASANARFVGGCVRDALLGIKSYDLDIALKGSINTLIEHLKTENIKHKTIGKKFLSIQVFINDIVFEITSLRKDVYCDGRHCHVEQTDSFEEDSKRRDFTINAIYVSFDEELFDYHSGISDLKNETIRFIGDPQKRILEDYLRILRYYRFSCIFPTFKVDYSSALRQNASGLKMLSKERIQQELVKIVNHPNSGAVLTKMDDDGVLQQISSDYNIDALINLNSTGSHSLEEKLLTLFGVDQLEKSFIMTKKMKRFLSQKKLNIY